MKGGRGVILRMSLCKKQYSLFCNKKSRHIKMHFLRVVKLTSVVSVISRPLSITISNQHSCILLQHLMLSQPALSACNHILNRQLIFFWCCLFLFAMVKHYACWYEELKPHKSYQEEPQVKHFPIRVKIEN